MLKLESEQHTTVVKEALSANSSSKVIRCCKMVPIKFDRQVRLCQFTRLWMCPICKVSLGQKEAGCFPEKAFGLSIILSFYD